MMINDPHAYGYHRERNGSTFVRNLHPNFQSNFNPRPVLEFPGQSLLRSFHLTSEHAIGVSLQDSGLAEPPGMLLNKTIYSQCIHDTMTTSVYSIRLEKEIRLMMEEMDDINWQAEIKQMVEKTIKERKKQRILARAEERWNGQVPNERGAAEMIREDRDAR